MKLDLEGKVALVTGSSRGIGRSIAITLASAGCDVMITGRDESALKEVESKIKELGRRVAFHVDDLRVEAGSVRLADALRATYDRLDILVNNAGATKRGDFLSLTSDDWRDGFALKFFGHVFLTRALWPMLQAARGSVVAIAGTGGRVPGADFTIGSSVNSACVAFAKALADRGKRDGVQVNSINPGHTDTERFAAQMRSRGQELGFDDATVREEYRKELGIRRFGVPDDVAGLVAFLVSSHGSWLHGATIDIDGGEVPAL